MGAEASQSEQVKKDRPNRKTRVSKSLTMAKSRPRYDQGDRAVSRNKKYNRGKEYNDADNQKFQESINKSRGNVLRYLSDDQDLITEDEVLCKYTLPSTNHRCPKGNEITHVCLEPNCKHPALYCSASYCRSCHKSHEKCFNLRFKAFTEMVTERQGKHREFLRNILDMENTMIKRIKDARQKMVEKMAICDLEDNFLETIDKIYFKRERNSVKGRETRDLTERLRLNTDKEVQHAADLFKQFSDKGFEMTTNYQKLKDKTMKSFTSGNKMNLQSHVLDQMKESEAHQKYLKKCLGKPRGISLIYRASENQYRAQEFHRRCDGIDNTLVLMRTEYGKTLGGFSRARWNSTVCDVAPDQSGTSFLFSLDLREKWPLKSRNQSIFCQQSLGPCFGTRDLHISDNCYFESTSFCQFPDSYESKNRFEPDARTRQTLCGSRNGRFKVLEYEVYEVTF